MSPLTITRFPRAILHIDGDAFFASCEQSRDLALKNKPVITGKERGIASSMSYEAKAMGVTRAMSLRDIKKVCPDAIILPSDYETYSLLSKRFYSIVRRYTPQVEEYGIDECFADITGLRRTYRTSYEKIADKIQQDLKIELGFSFSIGLGPNKSIAKIGSKFNKPSGLICIPGKKIHEYLKNFSVEKVWGIGPATTAYLNKFGIKTALDLALKDEKWIQKNLTKPGQEIHAELNGKFLLELNLEEKTSQASIQKFKTFTPPSDNKEFIFSQLCKNIENALIKARRYDLSCKKLTIVLRSQDFRHSGIEIKLSSYTNFSHELIKAVESVFDKIYHKNTLYRATGVTLTDLSQQATKQLDLFSSHAIVEKYSRLYEAIDKAARKFGKHTLFLGSSFQAHKFSTHLGERGDKPQRQTSLLLGETNRKRLGIPAFIGKIN